MSVFQLTQRGVLAISGPKAADFLQGMMTQNMRKLSADNPIYTAFLTSQGRVLYDGFIIKKSDDTYLIDVAKDNLMALAKYLHTYQMRFEINFEDLSDNYQVAYSFDDNASHPNALFTYTDPRLSAMGTRFIVATDTELESGDSAYEEKRIKLGLPHVGIDSFADKTLANELCLADIQGVDYEKGCYVGQEITARTHFRTQPKKRLMCIEASSPLPAAGTKLQYNGKDVAELAAVAGNDGIAVVRLNQYQDLSCQGQEIKAHKPTWASYEV